MSLPSDSIDLVVLEALMQSSLGVMLCDRKGTILWVNDGWQRMSGYTAVEAIGQTPALLNSGEQSRRYYERLWQVISDGNAWDGELVEKHKNGETYRVHQTVTPVCHEGGQVSHFLAVHQPVDQAFERRTALEANALSDPDTGLLPPAALMRRINTALRADAPFQLCFFEIRIGGAGFASAEIEEMAAEAGAAAIDNSLPPHHGLSDLGQQRLAALYDADFTPQQFKDVAHEVLAAISSPLPGLGPLDTPRLRAIAVLPEAGESANQLLLRADNLAEFFGG